MGREPEGTDLLNLTPSGKGLLQDLLMFDHKGCTLMRENQDTLEVTGISASGVNVVIPV
jgi:hypothetical protein